MARGETRTNYSGFLNKRNSLEILKRERANSYSSVETSSTSYILDKMIRKRENWNETISRAQIIKRNRDRVETMLN